MTKKIKTKDLKPGFAIFGNKGSLWTKKAHIMECGFSSTTLCGTPMLSTNHCKDETEIGCPECITKYHELNTVTA